MIEIEIVVRTVQIGGHSRDEIAAMLATIRVAQFDGRDFAMAYH
jgi:hypothetical protein